MHRPQLHDSPEARRNPDFSHIDVSERARAAVLTVTDRINHPHRGIGARLAVMMRDMVRLVELGATEAEMRAAYEVAVVGLIDDLFPDANAMDFETLRRIESEHDRAEDQLQDLLGIRGLTPVMLEDWGKAQIRAAVSSKACGRRAVAMARKLRSEKEVGRSVSLDRLQPSVER